MVVVEVVRLDGFFDEIAGRLLHHAAETLAVQTAPVARANVALRPGHDEFLPIFELTANLHAAVADAVLETDLEGQFKIAVLLLAAKEGIVLGIFRRVTDDGTVLDAPILGQTFPAFEILAIEKAGSRRRPAIRLGRIGPHGRDRDEGGEK